MATTSLLTGSKEAISSLFVGLSPSLPPLFTLTKIFAILFGVCLIVHAITRLVKLTKSPEHQTESKFGIFIEFFAGALLIQLDASLAAMSESIFTSQTSYHILAYDVKKAGALDVAAQAQNVILAIMSFVQFIGYASFFRGVLILNKVANGSRNESLGKGLTHVIGGCLAANIQLTGAMLIATIAPQITSTPF